jgi:hypothetical protein
MQGYVLHNPVAFIEDPQRSDALGHGRDSRLVQICRRRGVRNHRLRLILVPAAPAGSECEPNQQGRRELYHAYSGIHGS